MGTFATQSVLLHLILVLAKRRKIRKNSKIWVFEAVGTCRYFQILTGTFLKIQVLLDTRGFIKQSENGNIWSMGGETDRERDLVNYSINE